MKYEEVKSNKPNKLGEFVDTTEDGANYIVKLSEDKVYELAPIAYYIWNMCDGEKTVEDIVNEVSKEASLPVDQVKDPVVAILDELMKADLVKM
ncbi:MAG: PqqD family protein [Sulfolobaceae archaeon]|nr:PqqD family protein [Sulfolobaceae archaeon]